MHHPRCLVTSLLTGLLLFTACAPASQNASYPNQAYPDTVSSLNTDVSQPTVSATALLQAAPTRLGPTITNIPHRYPPTTTDVPPEWLYTATPDPQMFTIVAKIVGDYSQEEIARMLYTKWLDHFLGENISEADRLDEFALDSVEIPVDQKCAKKSGGLFFVNASAIVKPTIQRSEWFSGSGNTLEGGRIDKPFSGVVYKDGDTYTLIMTSNVPPC